MWFTQNELSAFPFCNVYLWRQFYDQNILLKRFLRPELCTVVGKWGGLVAPRRFRNFRRRFIWILNQLSELWDGQGCAKSYISVIRCRQRLSAVTTHEWDDLMATQAHRLHPHFSPIQIRNKCRYNPNMWFGSTAINIRGDGPVGRIFCMCKRVLFVTTCATYPNRPMFMCARSHQLINYFNAFLKTHRERCTENVC